MNKNGFKKMMTILENNKKWPIIIAGISGNSLSNAIMLPATIPSDQLDIVPDDEGMNYPAWIMQMMICARKSDKVYLVIDGLDDIDFDEQEKFYTILKHKSINGYKFPDNVQIVIAIKSGNISRISDKIATLCISFNVEK